MLRDIDEVPLVFLLLLLPLFLGAWALRRGSRLGAVPIGTTVATVALWYLYYASDAFPRIGGPNGLFVTLVVAGSSLLVAVIAMARSGPKAE